MATASNEMGQSNEVELLCWILGDDANCIFPVEMEKGKTVGHLKDMIKDKNTDALRDVDAKFLTLWKIDDFNLENIDKHSLKSLVPQQDSNRFQILMPWKTISKTWPSQPPQDKLHIVITKRANPIGQFLRSSTFRSSILNLIPWMAALYFIVKTLQASAAQAYASLRQDKIPEFIVGYMTNVSTSDNLKSYGDMINFRSVYMMFIIGAVVLALFVVLSLILSGIPMARY